MRGYWTFRLAVAVALALAGPAVAQTCALDNGVFRVAVPRGLAPLAQMAPQPDGPLVILRGPGVDCSFMRRGLPGTRGDTAPAMQQIFVRDLTSTAKALARPLDMEPPESSLGGLPHRRAALRGAGVPPVFHGVTLISVDPPAVAQSYCRALVPDADIRAALWAAVASVHIGPVDGVPDCAQ